MSLHFGKKLARFVFDIGVVNTTDDNGMKVVLGLQQLWSDTRSNRRLY